MLVTQGLIQAVHATRLAKAASAQSGRTVRAVVVLRSFDPADFIRASVDFARHLRAESGREWVGSFTRTVFLAGDPANLTARFPDGRLAPAGSSLWFSPSGLDACVGLSRLLRPFRGPVGVPPADGVRVVLDEKSSSRARLCVATGGLGIEDYLIHVNHLLAEACLEGLLDGVGAIELTHVAAIKAIDEPWAALRALPDKGCAGIKGIVWAVLTPSEVR